MAAVGKLPALDRRALVPTGPRELTACAGWHLGVCGDPKGHSYTAAGYPRQLSCGWVGCMRVHTPGLFIEICNHLLGQGDVCKHTHNVKHGH